MKKYLLNFLPVFLFISCTPLTMNSYEIKERLEGLKKVNNFKPLSDKDYEYNFIG